MVRDPCLLYNVRSSPYHSVTAVDGNKLQIMGIGQMAVTLSDRTYLLDDVLHVPSSTQHLLSVGGMATAGVKAVFQDAECLLRDAATGQLLIRVPSVNRLFHLPIKVSTETVGVASASHVKLLTPAQLWHARFAHAGFETLEHAARCQMHDNMHVPPAAFHKARAVECTACMQGKHKRSPFPHAHAVASRPMQLVHTDVCEVKPLGARAERYFVTALDAYSGFAVVHVLQHKHQVAAELISMLTRMETASGQKLAALRSDNGGEYLCASLQAWLDERGVHHQRTQAYTPQQNGAAERLNGVLLERLRAVLTDVAAPHTLWPELLLAVARIHNLLPSKKHTATPFELFLCRKPDVARLRVLGSRAYVWVPHRDRAGKLDARGAPGRLVGYSDTGACWRILLDSGNVVESRDVRFDEADHRMRRSSGPGMNELGLCPQPYPVDLPAPVAVIRGSAEQTQTLLPARPSDTVAPDVSVQDPGGTCDLQELPAPQHVQAQAAPPDEQRHHYSPPLTRLRAAREREQRSAMLPALWQKKVGDMPALHAAQAAPQRAAKDQSDVPSTYQEAMSSPHKQFWLEAMLAELRSLQENGVYVQLPRKEVPAMHSVLPLRWVFTKKYTTDGELDRFKARVVVQGFRQRPGIDYVDTFAPTSNRVTFRAFLSFVATEDLELRQLDVRTAFLQSDLDEVVYVSPPPGFQATSGADVVYRLNKALYGLKQAPRAWHQKLCTVLCGLGYVPSKADPGLYVLRTDAGIVLLLTYVDDLLLAGKRPAQLSALVAAIAQQLDVRDLGEARMFLNMHIVRDRAARTLLLHQAQQVTDLLGAYNMSDCTPASTPLPAGVNLTAAPNSPAALAGDRLALYQALVGSINYIAGNTRPDIAFAAGVLSRALGSPHEFYWKAALHLLRYLQGTVNKGLKYGPVSAPCQLVCYHDADYAADAVTRKSITGFVWMIGSTALQWRSKQQSVVADSTTAAEYIA
jgi:transposase InsO family protein